MTWKMVAPAILLAMGVAGAVKSEAVRSALKGKRAADTSSARSVVKTEKEWKEILTPEQYRVLRQMGTEMAFTGKYHDFKGHGLYRCAGCGLELFSSDTKYDSRSGWPSFWTPIAEENVEEVPDHSLGMRRVEVVCHRCGGHLGHVFEDGPKPTGLRYCINSAALEFEKREVGEKQTEKKKEATP